MREIDDKVILAANDELLLSELLREHHRFIINCAYGITHKYITKSDDEWSISLIAFSNAIQTYDKSKGSFLAYAELLIKRNLIDYYRSQKKYTPELSVSPDTFESSGSMGSSTDSSMDDSYSHSIRSEITKKLSHTPDEQQKYEIQAANSVFQELGFTFFDLVKCSPKSYKTKHACKKAVLYLLENPLLLNQIMQTKQLPIKIIQKNTGLPRKILEHHRKYIIAAIILLSGEYPLLAEYISYIRKEDI